MKYANQSIEWVIRFKKGFPVSGTTPPFPLVEFYLPPAELEVAPSSQSKRALNFLKELQQNKNGGESKKDKELLSRSFSHQDILYQEQIRRMTKEISDLFILIQELVKFMKHPPPPSSPEASSSQ